MRQVVRPFLNVPVVWKLGLSAFISLALLAALGVLLYDGVGKLTAAKDSELRSVQAEAAVLLSEGKAREAVATSSRIATAQTQEAVRQALRETVDTTRESERQIRAALSLAESRDINATVEEAARLLSQLAEAAEHLARTREEALRARDEELIPASQDYEQAFEAILAGLEFEVSERQREEVRERLMAAHQAANELRVGTLRFLATGDPQAARRLRGALAQARIHLRAAGQMGSERHRADVARVAQIVDRLGNGTMTILNSLATATRIEQETMSPLLEQLQEKVNVAVSAFAQEREQALARSAYQISSAERTLFGLGAMIVILLLSSSIGISMTIAAPLRRLAARIGALKNGDAVSAVSDTDRRDEIGVIAHALDGLRGTVSEAFERQQMIEQLPTGIMTADVRDGVRLRYVNPAAKELIGAVRHALQVDPEGLVGQPLSVVFGSEAQHTLEVLNDPSQLPHRFRIRLGEEVVDVSVSALKGADGTYIGPMVAWTPVTAQAKLADRFEAEVGAVIETLAAQAERVQAAARSLSESADASKHEASVVAAASEEASGEVRSVAASAEQMAASIVDMSRSVTEVANSARRAVEEVQATQKVIQGLSEEASRIGEIVRLIDDIATETNLLALNATIEAARAGEAGKGFAVVASEVKNLAAQTAKATEDIASRISGIQGSTEQAVKAIVTINHAIQKTNEIANAIAAAVEEQGAATQEIAKSAARVAAGTETVSRQVSDIRQRATNTGEAAGDLLVVAESLSREADSLKGHAQRFLASVRAA